MNTIPNTRGFTLVKVVVAIGVVALLSGILVPIVSKNLEDAKIARARNEVHIYGAAMGSFYKDTGYWPFFLDGMRRLDPFYLLLMEKGQMPTDIRQGKKWLKGRIDTFENQMLYNKPGGNSRKAHLTSGEFGWRGPYLAEIKPDPWGMTYIARMGIEAISVISAGPNRKLETSPDSVEALGDDILFRLMGHNIVTKEVRPLITVSVTDKSTTHSGEWFQAPNSLKSYIADQSLQTTQDFGLEEVDPIIWTVVLGVISHDIRRPVAA